MDLRVSRKDYIEFRIPKRTKPGQPTRYRTLHSPKPALRSKQLAVMAELKKFRLATSNRAFAYRRGVGLRDLGEAHLGAHYALKMDLTDFFPSILPRHLLPKVSGSFAQNLALCFLPTIDNKPGFASISRGQGLPMLFVEGLPQGAPSSPSLSNLAASRLDDRLARLVNALPQKPMVGHRINPFFGSPPITYTRYADDLTFSSAGASVLNLPHLVSNIVRDCGFRVNRKKTRRIKKGNRIDICGVVVNEKVNARRDYRRMVRSTVHRAVRDVIHGRCDPGFMLHHGELQPVDVEGLLGKLSFISYLNPELSMNNLRFVLLDVHGRPRQDWSYVTRNYLQPSGSKQELLQHV